MPSQTLPCDVLPVTGGVLVIPHVLPVHVPDAVHELTVREWLDLERRNQTPPRAAH